MCCSGLILEEYGPADFIITHPFNREFFFNYELHLISCPGITNAEFDILSKVDYLTKRLLFSYNLVVLKLTRRNNFTIGALKDMVKVRGTNSPWGFMQRRNILSVEVSGYGAPLAVEDGNWIADRLIGMVSMAVNLQTK